MLAADSLLSLSAFPSPEAMEKMVTTIENWLLDRNKPGSVQGPALFEAARPGGKQVFAMAVAKLWDLHRGLPNWGIAWLNRRGTLAKKARAKASEEWRYSFAALEYILSQPVNKTETSAGDTLLWQMSGASAFKARAEQVGSGRAILEWIEEEFPNG
jgi:hypothetical protein